ncbi:hypothetical protein N8I77_010179 [Diaporthe amygdali]|uniref:Uncharacterized protein n=1 Tax=Phomopsis amygdali TaxID=1214568 RepID=A0AAD9S9B4_PHOAM|nr:uncharacterized protein J7T55_011567 [Diaporthe amygdali]KAJ0123103.1 hypothetical protein J7T55_011567 [Diaporthe amygdali]KAK2600659.1 hypothetical protein N8I77_010179 [Diaporthe amygdali]
MFAPITALFAATALLPGLASATVLSGSGTISVLNSSSFTTATPDMNIGCVDATGKLVVDECATFTFRDTYPYGVSTSAGNCSFTNSSQQANTDSHYGANSYAWSCWPHEAAVTDQLYTIDGMAYNFLCQGDTDCYYDIPSAPSGVSQQLPVWRFTWGSAQPGITPGHLKTLFLWEPTSSS